MLLFVIGDVCATRRKVDFHYHPCMSRTLPGQLEHLSARSLAAVSWRGLTSSRCSGEPPACPWGVRGSRGRTLQGAVQLSQEVLKGFPPRDHFNDNLTEEYMRGIIVKLGSSSFLFLIISTKKREVLCNRPQKSFGNRPSPAAVPYLPG